MKLLRPLFIIGSTGFWLLMTSLLIQKEFFQLTPLQSAYQFLPLQNWDLRQEYHGIYLGKELIGFNWNVLEKKARETYEFRHSTYLSFAFLGQSREMLVLQTAHLNRNLTLQDFNVRIKSGQIETSVKGEIKDKRLETYISNTGREATHQTFPASNNLFLADTLDFLWIPENLKIGKQGTFKIWNPLTMSAEDIQFHVKRKEKIAHDGKEIETYRIGMKIGDFEISRWVTPDGVALKSESVSGLLFENQDAYKVFDALRKKRDKPADLPNLFSIPSNRIFNKPTELSYLKVRIETPKEDRIIEIRRADLSKFDSLRFPLPFADKPELEKYLTPSTWVESNDTLIVLTAKSIAGAETSALKKAEKINDWLHKNISPVPTMGIPRASDVLSAKRDDCNEYTVLFTAFARALKLPARMQAGLIYQNGRFFYHAWPEVFLGEWVGFDPTFNEAPADATHIPLVEGDMDQQINLAAQIGRIKIHILESSEH